MNLIIRQHGSFCCFSLLQIFCVKALHWSVCLWCRKWKVKEHVQFYQKIWKSHFQQNNLFSLFCPLWLFPELMTWTFNHGGTHTYVHIPVPVCTCTSSNFRTAHAVFLKVLTCWRNCYLTSDRTYNASISALQPLLFCAALSQTIFLFLISFIHFLGSQPFLLLFSYVTMYTATLS